METVLVTAIVIFCAFYAGRSAWRALTLGGEGSCAGCSKASRLKN